MQKTQQKIIIINSRLWQSPTVTTISDSSARAPKSYWRSPRAEPCAIGTPPRAAADIAEARPLSRLPSPPLARRIAQIPPPFSLYTIYMYTCVCRHPLDACFISTFFLFTTLADSLPPAASQSPRGSRRLHVDALSSLSHVIRCTFFIHILVANWLLPFILHKHYVLMYLLLVGDALCAE